MKRRNFLFAGIGACLAPLGSLLRLFRPGIRWKKGKWVDLSELMGVPCRIRDWVAEVTVPTVPESWIKSTVSLNEQPYHDTQPGRLVFHRLSLKRFQDGWHVQIVLRERNPPWAIVWAGWCWKRRHTHLLPVRFCRVHKYDVANFEELFQLRRFELSRNT